MDGTQILNEIAAELASEQDVQVSKWFGMPCLKINGKIFATLARNTVAGAAQAQKNAIIRGLLEARSNILAEVRALPTGEQDRVFLGTWSVKDMLAHLVGWDVTNLEAVGEVLAGQKPSFFQYHDPDWQTYNARLVAEHKRDDLVGLVASVEASHQRLIDFL